MDVIVAREENIYVSVVFIFIFNVAQVPLKP